MQSKQEFPTDTFVFKMQLIKGNGNTAQQQRRKNTIKNAVNKTQITVFNAIIDSVNFLMKISFKN